MKAHQHLKEFAERKKVACRCALGTAANTGAFEGCDPNLPRYMGLAVSRERFPSLCHLGKHSLMLAIRGAAGEKPALPRMLAIFGCFPQETSLVPL